MDDRAMSTDAGDTFSAPPAALSESDGDAALRTAFEAFVGMDASGRVLRWNDGATRLFGYEASAAIGQDLAELIVPPHHRAHHRAGLQRYLSTGASRVVGQRVEVDAVDSSGRQFRAQLALWVVPDDGQPWFAAMVRDVSELVVAREAAHEASREARAAQRELAMLVNHAPIGMALVGLDGRWLLVNPALLQVTGYTEPELLGLTFQDITHPDDLDADLELVRQLIAGDVNQYALDKRYRRRDGSFVWVTLSVSLVRDDNGAPVHFISQIQDITDRRATQQALERKAQTDALTGLADRAVLDERTRSALTDLPADGLVGLALIDLDGFKRINDEFGHLAGDAVLVETAHRLLANARGRDTVARFGGDEFAILLDAPGDAPAVAAFGRRLLTALRVPIVLPNGTEVQVTASIGLATTTDRTTYTASLYGWADKAMYAVKAAGRDGIRLEHTTG
jgi:diguanylate cyclase (GGDEF)-like protein/PAS domain S-box-containing protein